MKKTLVALAALAVVGAASAQSTVTLFGSIDASVGVRELKQTGAAGAFGAGVVASDRGPEVMSGQQNGSRWGMRGSEDLGGGMKANFNLTNGFNIDTANQAQGGLLFGREAWVGLSGGFGAITLGRQVTIMANGPWAITGGYANYDAWSTPTDNGFFGNPGSIATDAVRKNNSVQYQTPNMGGFTGTVMWAPGENGIAGGTNNTNYYSLGLGYVNGPIGIQFAYEKDTLRTGGAAAGAATVGIVAGAIAIVPGAAATPLVQRSQNQWALGASYNFGIATISGSVLRASLGTVDDRGWAMGLSAPLGPVSLDFEYARERTTTAGAFTSNADAINFRVNYPLSKRTKVYALVSDGDSRTAAAATRQSMSRYMVGMRHVF